MKNRKKLFFILTIEQFLKLDVAVEIFFAKLRVLQKYTGNI